MDNLDTLLAQRRDVWRGSRQPACHVFPTGQAKLDEWLPHRGWPSGQIIALHATHIGSGELSVLLPFFALQTQKNLPVLLISPPLVPCPQALIQAGVALQNFIVIRPQKKQLWATEQALRSGSCGAVVIWPHAQNWSDATMRRLQLACERGTAPLFVVEHQQRTCLPWSCALHLIIQPGPILSWFTTKALADHSNTSMQGSLLRLKDCMSCG